MEVLAIPYTSEPADGDDEPATYVLGPGADAARRLLHQHLGAEVDLIALLEHHGAKGAAGDVVEVPVVAAQVLPPAPPRSAPPSVLRSVLLVGLGRSRPQDLRRAGAALSRRTRGRTTVATTLGAATDAVGLAALIEGVVLGAFVFSLKTAPGPAPVRRVVLAGVPDAEDRQPELSRCAAAARASWRARALALTSSDLKTPDWLARQAVDVADERGLEVEVWDERRLHEEGFGGILGVGQASDRPPRLVQLGYTPDALGSPDAPAGGTPHVVLIGKGITFDTGGLSLKPAEAMAPMKRDMTGAGVVLSVLGTLREVGCPVRVTGLLACAENSVSGRSLRPGDVIRHHGGRTSEVTNTDAEGRLVLADALAYAVAALQPTVLVDVATLTGAAKIALGQRLGALFSTDDALATALREAGDEAGEPLWRLPLAQDYEERLESGIADADNAPGGPGAVTAALFLRHFTGGLPWAHLDIASVGDSPTDAHEWTSGATGFGARALLRWLARDEPLVGVGALG